MIERETG